MQENNHEDENIWSHVVQPLWHVGLRRLVPFDMQAPLMMELLKLLYKLHQHSLSPNSSSENDR